MAVFLSTLVLPVAITFYLQHGSEAAAQFKALLEEFRTVWTDTMVSVSEEVFANSNDNLSEIFNKETVSALVDTTINLLPAILIILSNVVAFSVHTLSLHARERIGEIPQDSEKKFLLSKVSAWLYIISFIAVFFGASDSVTANILALALQNINLILTPSFLFAGIAIWGSSFFTALGNGLVSALISFLRTLVFQIAAVIVFPLIWELDGIWISIVATELMAEVVTVLFLVGMRKKYRY